MRLFLLPVSTRRTLIYCQRLNVTTTEKQGWIDRCTTKAAQIWAGWEKRERGWQKKVVDYGNEALKRIPYEEWGLKSVPPLSARRRAEELAGKEKIEVCFPPTLLPEESVASVLRKLGTERQPFHGSRMRWCLVGMPIAAPIGLIPVIPNIPFFYLLFRAWSHWRALSGSKHIEFLVNDKLLTPKPSRILDEIYLNSKQRAVLSLREEGAEPRAAAAGETMALHESDGKTIADALKIPGLEVEVHRAVWQVEKALRAEAELQNEKRRDKPRPEAREAEKKEE